MPILSHLKSIGSLLLKPQVVRQRPLHIQLEPTNYCNLKCQMCSRDKVIKNPKHMLFINFKRIIDMIQPEKITLSGYGEPLINPELVKMIIYGKEKNANINTTSNFTLMSQEKAMDLVRSGLDLISASIDAATPATYLKIRGEDFFNKIIDGIRTLVHAKEGAKSSTPYIRLCFVVQMLNIEEITQFIRMAKELRVDVIYFQILELTNIEHKKESLVGNIDYDRFYSLISKAFATANDLGIKTNIGSFFRNLPIVWKKYTLERQGDKNRCILPWFSTYITADGDLMPCCQFAPTPVIMGNILTPDFETVWNGERYTRLRGLIREGKRPYNICKNCLPEGLLDILKRTALSPGFFSRGIWPL